MITRDVFGVGRCLTIYPLSTTRTHRVVRSVVRADTDSSVLKHTPVVSAFIYLAPGHYTLVYTNVTEAKSTIYGRDGRWLVHPAWMRSTHLPLGSSNLCTVLPDAAGCCINCIRKMPCVSARR